MTCRHSCAWVTLLTQPAYLPGVETLQRSLVKSNSRWPLLVMVTANIAENIRHRLQAQGCLIRQVTPVGPNPVLAHNYAFTRFAEVWTKLVAWSLTEFKRLVFLDADMLIIKNMDELFELSIPDGQIAACHACRCNPDKITSFPSNWCPEHCFYSWCKDSSMKASSSVPMDNYLNSGLLVPKPDAKVYRRMVALLDEMTDISVYYFPEQDFLNEFYHERWLPLHYGYNALKTLSLRHSQLWDMQQIKNIHYILGKPWEKYPQTSDKWYQLDKLWLQYNMNQV